MAEPLVTEAEALPGTRMLSALPLVPELKETAELPLAVMAPPFPKMSVGELTVSAAPS